jgi:predicted N-acetyltransferase YhbS
MAYYKNKFVGSALLELRQDYSVLLGLYVYPSHRGKGVGSCLVQYIIRGIDHPIYLHAVLGSESFYSRLRFIRTRERKGYNMVLRRSIWVEDHVPNAPA